jgi:hypothetical protein
MDFYPDWSFLEKGMGKDGKIKMILRNTPAELFLVSQALYGIMIAYPKMKEDKMVEKAFRLAKKIMEKSKQK